jgi:hypothetical protein
MTDTLIGYRAVWKQKAVLRILCNDIFERIAGSVVDGTTLELERFSVDVNRNSKGVPKGAQIRFGLL